MALDQQPAQSQDSRDRFGDRGVAVTSSSPDATRRAHAQQLYQRSSAFMLRRAAYAVASTPEDIAQVQTMLKSAGLLSGTFAVGLWDEKSVAAITNLQRYARGTGQDLNTALTSYATALNGGVAPNDGTGWDSVPTFQAQVTSAADLRLALKDASAQLSAGGAFDDKTIDRLVGVYQAQEAEDQRAAFNAQLTGGQVEAPRSADTILRETVRAEDPSGVGAREVATRYNEFLGALGSPVVPVKL